MDCDGSCGVAIINLGPWGTGEGFRGRCRVEGLKYVSCLPYHSRQSCGFEGQVHVGLLLLPMGAKGVVLSCLTGCAFVCVIIVLALCSRPVLRRVRYVWWEGFMSDGSWGRCEASFSSLESWNDLAMLICLWSCTPGSLITFIYITEC